LDEIAFGLAASRDRFVPARHQGPTPGQVRAPALTDQCSVQPHVECLISLDHLLFSAAMQCANSFDPAPTGRQGWLDRCVATSGVFSAWAKAMRSRSTMSAHELAS